MQDINSSAINLAYPPEIAAWTNETKQRQREAAAKVQQLIDDAVKNGSKSVCIPKGDYRFANDLADRMKIHNAKNITIDFSGSTLWIENRGMGNLRGIEVHNCENCLIKNLYLDYDPMPYFQGVITKIDKDNRSIDIRADEGFYFPDDEWLSTSGSQMKTIFFDKDGEMLQSPMNWVALKDGIKILDDKNIRITFRLDSTFLEPSYTELAEKGFRVVIPWRRNVGVKIMGCSGVTFEDLTIYADPGTGIYETFGKGGTVLKRLNMIRRPETKRMLVSNADAIHMLGTETAMHIEDSHVEYAGDDLVNSNAFYSYVYKVRSDTEFIAVSMYDNKLSAGEKLRFLDLKSWKRLGQATIKSVSEIDYGQIAEDVEKIKENFENNCGICVRKVFSLPRAFSVTLDKPAELKTFDVIEAGNSAKGFTAKNSKFIGSIANGVRIRTAKTLIENCVFAKSHEAGLLLGSSCFWSEGADMYDVVVKNNIFECNAKSFIGEVKAELVMLNEPGGINKNVNNEIQSRNFTITGNKFINPLKYAIEISNTENIDLSDNEFVWNGDLNYKRCDEKDCVVTLGAVKNVRCGNNVFKSVPSYIKNTVVLSEYAENVETD